MENQIPIKTEFSVTKLISILLLGAILLIIPITVVILGQRTREQIKADITCKQPVIPDPKECVNGQWKLYTNLDDCTRFRCELY